MVNKPGISLVKSILGLLFPRILEYRNIFTLEYGVVTMESPIN
jgi:hypothetical protein